MGLYSITAWYTGDKKKLGQIRWTHLSRTMAREIHRLKASHRQELTICFNKDRCPGVARREQGALAQTVKPLLVRLEKKIKCLSREDGSEGKTLGVPSASPAR